MPAQPPVRELEEEMEAEGESQLPEANGEVEQPRENQRGGRRGWATGGAGGGWGEAQVEQWEDMEDKRHIHSFKVSIEGGCLDWKSEDFPMEVLNS